MYSLVRDSSSRLISARGTVFAAPTFSESPWLVNHATRADCQQEDHLVRVVVPTALALLGNEARPPVLLLGFGKGGFAALHLLTRHPGLFAVAGVRGASLLSDRPPHPQLVEVAGSTARLDEYDVRQNLHRHARALQGARRRRPSSAPDAAAERDRSPQTERRPREPWFPRGLRRTGACLCRGSRLGAG
ncbi:hypothetical protein ACIQMY_02880 [Streptomyces sp. NPDC091368]|uniref:hypothetical protein n=1 Tax=Streptomyces sp. NPDC091368 TaxID=3365993 RepID=UPI0037F9E09D